MVSVRLAAATGGAAGISVHDGVAIQREVPLEHVLDRRGRHGVDARGPRDDFLRIAAEQVHRLQAAQPVAVLLQRGLVTAPRGSFARFVRSADGPSCCRRLISVNTRSVIDAMFSGAAPKLTRM